jgi:trehalose/maltose hydrolase-like predicted phosphorylase
MPRLGKSYSKQADVLMLFYLLSAEKIDELFERLEYPFEYEIIPRNVAYYAAHRCHGSMLCRVVFTLGRQPDRRGETRRKL